MNDVQLMTSEWEKPDWSIGPQCPSRSLDVRFSMGEITRSCQWMFISGGVSCSPFHLFHSQTGRPVTIEDDNKFTLFLLLDLDMLNSFSWVRSAGFIRYDINAIIITTIIQMIAKRCFYLKGYFVASFSSSIPHVLHWSQWIGKGRNCSDVSIEENIVKQTKTKVLFHEY